MNIKNRLVFCLLGLTGVLASQNLAQAVVPKVVQAVVPKCALKTVLHLPRAAEVAHRRLMPTYGGVGPWRRDAVWVQDTAYQALLARAQTRLDLNLTKLPCCSAAAHTPLTSNMLLPLAMYTDPGSELYVQQGRSADRIIPQWEDFEQALNLTLAFMRDNNLGELPSNREIIKVSDSRFWNPVHSESELQSQLVRPMAGTRFTLSKPTSFFDMPLTSLLNHNATCKVCGIDNRPDVVMLVRPLQPADSRIRKLNLFSSAASSFHNNSAAQLQEAMAPMGTQFIISKIEKVSTQTLDEKYNIPAKMFGASEVTVIHLQELASPDFALEVNEYGLVPEAVKKFFGDVAPYEAAK